MALWLAACSSGGSVNVGGGQDTDPGTVDFPIAYVKRSLPMEDGQLAQDDIRQQRDAVPDAELYMRTRASPSSTEINVTGSITGGIVGDDQRYDIKDVDVSYDGTKIVFAMRGPLDEDQDEIDPPDWDIWEYDISGGADNGVLRRVIVNDTIAAAGQDIGPQYLPDDRIVFASTRQRQSQAILIDEGKPGYEAQVEQGRNESAFLLHVMQPDGTEIQQVTFNQSHDLWPSVLNNGRLMFTRWDGNRGMHLYTSNPDGSDLQLLYGARSHDTGTPDENGPTEIQFTRPREMQDGRILTLVRPFGDSDFGGDLVIIDAQNYVEQDQLASCAGTATSCAPGSVGPAQTRATPNEVSTVEGPSPGGRFRSAFPLWDGSNRLLVSWSLCRLRDNSQTPAANVPCTPDRLNDPTFDTRYETAQPLYSAFIFDPADNTFRPLFQPVEGVMVTDLVAAQPRVAEPAQINDGTGAPFDMVLAGQGLGLLEIRNVCDFDGAINATLCGATTTAMMADPMQRNASQRPARFLRIEKAVSFGDDELGFPDIDEDTAFGVANTMREIIGYVPIEPDGSVSVRVPADVAFVIAVLDANGRRLFPSHRAWLQLRPGEVRRCNGCHQTGGTQQVSHGRWDTTSPLVWRPGTSSMANPDWGAFLASTVEAFPNALATTSASANGDDTMAQARGRTSCVAGSLVPCSQRPSVNVIFEDVWTDPADRAPDPAFSYAYGALATPQPLNRAACVSNWDSTCRIIINYGQHIHPLWALPRGIDGADTCTNCHSTVDLAGVTQVPAGQLELSSDPSNQNQLHPVAYYQLLEGRVVRDLVGGALQPRQQQVGVDPDTGDPIMEDVQAGRVLQPGNARGSNRFFACFANDNTCATGDPDDTGGTFNHNALLTPAELRLISEWVDIGAQFFNNPFDAPTN